MKHSITDVIETVLEKVPLLERALREKKYTLEEESAKALRALRQAMDKVREKLSAFAALLDAHDPMRQLRLGYSILRREGNVLRSVKDVSMGATIEALLADGKISASVITIEQHDKKTPTTKH
jgi:exodeoxyribonuclease VII large subunit